MIEHKRNVFSIEIRSLRPRVFFFFLGGLKIVFRLVGCKSGRRRRREKEEENRRQLRQGASTKRCVHTQRRRSYNWGRSLWRGGEKSDPTVRSREPQVLVSAPSEPEVRLPLKKSFFFHIFLLCLCHSADRVRVVFLEGIFLVLCFSKKSKIFKW